MLNIWASQQGGIPAPFLVSDFKNGVYSKSGVPKIATDLWTIPANAAIVADVGLKLTAVDTATATASATANTFAALDLSVGFSGVIDVTTQVNDPATEYIQILAILRDTPFTNYSVLQVDSHKSSISGTPPAIEADSVVNNGANKLAFTFTPTTYSFSINGGPVVSCVAQPDFSSYTNFALMLDAFTLPVRTAIIRSLRLYSRLTNAQLQVLSHVDPLVVADFKNGIYKISGVAANFSDVLTPSGPFDPTHIVAGTGWVLQAPAGNVDEILMLTPAAFAALSVQPITVVMEHEILTPGGQPKSDTGAVISYSNDDFSSIWQVDCNPAFTSFSPPVGAYGLKDGLGADLTVATTNLANKLAVLFSPAQLAGSNDGAAAQTLSPVQSAAPTLFMIDNYAEKSDRYVVKRVTIYPGVIPAILSNYSS